ncbi:MAG: hypothetical protein HOP16_03220 [Acidobacteria bacterium]|nr:hypothetical protein [Acidobacteriota bacterium]
MRKVSTGIIAGVVGALCISALVSAQAPQNNAPRSPWKYYPEDARANEGPGGPAPVRDMSGTWAGESSGAGVKRLVPPERNPAFTALGKELFSKNKAESNGVLIAQSNDPHVRFCDPFGFPRNMNDQIRSMTIATVQNRTFVMLKFMNIWREIWMDGRALPTKFAGRGADVHDPTYNGYSVGRWVDDYTFVAETTGMAPETWATEGGLPHSVDAKVTERFNRSSKNDLSLTMTMDDPKLYSKPVSLGEVNFRWIPSQTFFDFSCVPSSVQMYLKEMADPSGTPAAAK